ncbi:DUF6962 family protein [Leptolyngbya sp. KIOST-1]|uniref:DUF6962 family protein n=1 Tax=Leptolyngbya sp. KIOST-1 TaxID=1229172 RepID=UPI0012E0338C|nr:hypothetical protein [Leptolyngbya sp. KIOST-1]
MLAEPITTLTDYAIALECLLFALGLRGRGWLAGLWATAFGSVGGAACLGGTLHGFALHLLWQQKLWLWQATLLALAIASLCIFLTVALSVPPRWRQGLVVLAIAKLALIIRLGTSPWAFAVSIADYLSALALVLLVQLRPFLRRAGPNWAWMAAGIATSGLAASTLLIPHHALPMSPAAVYHLVQMVALFCIYRSVRAVGHAPAGLPTGATSPSID